MLQGHKNSGTFSLVRPLRAAADLLTQHSHLGRGFRRGRLGRDGQWRLVGKDLALRGVELEVASLSFPVCTIYTRSPGA